MSVAPIADRPLPESPTGEPKVHSPAAHVKAAPASPFVQVMRSLGHERSEAKGWFAASFRLRAQGKRSDRRS
jgi:hypothetical protein